MYQIEIDRRASMRAYDFYIYQPIVPGRAFLLRFENGVVGYEEVDTRDYNAEHPPTLRIPDPLLEVLAGAINKLGVNLPKASHTEGKLEATEAHLADMRTLLGLGTPSVGGRTVTVEA